MFCAYCGAKLRDGVNFCENCGARVADFIFEEPVETNEDDGPQDQIDEEEPPEEPEESEAEAEQPEEPEEPEAEAEQPEEPEEPEAEEEPPEEADETEEPEAEEEPKAEEEEPEEPEAEEEEPEEAEETEEEKEPPEEAEEPAAGKKGAKVSSKMIGGIIAAAVVVVVIIAAVAVNPGKPVTVDLDAYIVEPSFYGYDGYGYAQGARFDEESFIADNEDNVKYTKALENEEDIELLELWYSSAAECLTDNFISGYLSSSSDLSNGDVVTYYWYLDDYDVEMIEEYFNVSLEFSESGVSFTVEGLEAMETVDVFADVVIEYYGKAPDAEVNYVMNTSSDPALSSINYTASPESGLNVGDTVTVSISDDTALYLEENYGIIPAETSREFTVENLDRYITSIQEIPDEMMEKLKSQSEDVISGYVANDWADYVYLSSAEYIGSYMLTPKDVSLLDHSGTTLYMVYKLQVHEFEDEDPDNTLDNTFEYYYFVKFYNPLILSDGTWTIDLTDYGTPKGYSSDSSSFTRTIDYSPSRWSDTTTLTYIGYPDLDSMFNNCVAKNVADYNYESTVAN